MTQQPPGRPWTYLLSGESVDVSLRHDHVTPFVRKRRSAMLAASLLTRAALTALRALNRYQFDGQFVDDGCIAVSFHHTYMDAIYPSALNSRVTPVVSNLCKKSHTRSWFLRLYGVIWANTDAIAMGADVARTKNICWIAPFGFSASKHGTFSTRAQLGAARIAVASQRPVVPVAITTVPRKSPFRRPTVVIGIGSPIFINPGERLRAFTDRYVMSLTELQARQDGQYRSGSRFSTKLAAWKDVFFRHHGGPS